MTLIEKSLIIKQLALETGFDDCGIARVHELYEDAENLKSWLFKDYHAGMYYMQNHFEKRIDPSKLVEDSKSVIVVLLNYFTENFPFEEKQFKFSRYALGKDYHFIVKEKLHQLLLRINEEIGTIQGRAFVDSAPVLERAWAKEAGLGWIGKNSLLINKKLGSFVFIGELIVDIELSYDTPSINEYCSVCTKCIDACPTQAIVSPKVINSNKCISYQTIENKGEIPVEIQSKLNGWVFGCDICQQVCPWNKRAISHKVPEFSNPELAESSNHAFESLSLDQFNQLFHDSPVKRAKFEGLKRNIKACMSNKA